MRIIDVDKLHYIRKWFEDSGKSEVVVFAKEIDKAPTVKAIPIDWLISKSKELVLTKGTKFYSILDLPIVYDLIEEWRKENEANR